MDQVRDLIKMINDWCQSRELDLATQYQLTGSEMRVFRCFKAEKDQPCMGELAKRMDLGESRITRIVSSMENKGLVKRKSAKEDHRVTQVQMTKKGSIVFDRIFNQCDEIWEKIWKKVPDDRRDQIVLDFGMLLQAMGKIEED